eukprot:1252882-Alexandrium_andersonii.AAC.1
MESSLWNAVFGHIATSDVRCRRTPLIAARPSPADGPLAGAGDALGDRPGAPHVPGLHEPKLLGAGRRDQLRVQSCPRDVVT